MAFTFEPVCIQRAAARVRQKKVMKATALSCLLALVAVAVNWQSEQVYVYTNSTTKTSIDGAGLVILFCIAAFLLLLRGIYKQVRRCLDQGIRIPCQVRLIRFWPCILLLPLLVHWNTFYSETIQDGAQYTHSYGYGSPLSAYALLLCVIIICTYQFYKGVSGYIENHQKVEPRS